MTDRQRRPCASAGVCVAGERAAHEVDPYCDLNQRSEILQLRWLEGLGLARMENRLALVERCFGVPVQEDANNIRMRRLLDPYLVHSRMTA